MPDAPNHQVHPTQVPIPLGHPPLLPLLARPTLPAMAAPRPNYGVTSNQAMPILREFRPYQGHPSSTSEQNRQISMTRKTNKKKKNQGAKARDEPLALEPVDTDVSIMLFPLNVRVFYLC
jgi:hypothetical protein